MCSLWIAFGNKRHEEGCRTSWIFLGIRGDREREGMRDRGRLTCAQMLIFCCTGACMLLLIGMVA